MAVRRRASSPWPATADAHRIITERMPRAVPIVNNWQLARLDKRKSGDPVIAAAASMLGLLWNPAEISTYDIAFFDGANAPLDGSNRYVLRYDPPPPRDSALLAARSHPDRRLGASCHHQALNLTEAVAMNTRNHLVIACVFAERPEARGNIRGDIFACPDGLALPNLHSDPAGPRKYSNWPDFRPDGRPRSATVAVRKADGGPIGT